jgi:hypothetical protein
MFMMEFQNQFISKKSRILFLFFFMQLSFSDAQKLSFNNQVSGIILKNCSPCHREGESAPFPLLSFQDVASKAKMIKEVINSGYMPPWKQDPLYRHFENEKVLSGEEIKLINEWIDSGAKEGKPVLNSGNPDEFPLLAKPD